MEIEQNKRNYKRIESMYNKIALAIGFIVFSLFSFAIGQQNIILMQVMAFFIAILILGSVELYYLGINRQDLIRRYAISFELKDSEKRIPSILELLSNDGRVLLFSIISLIFLQISVSGMLPLIPLSQSTELTPFWSEFAAWLPYVIATTSIPAMLRFKALTAKSNELQRVLLMEMNKKINNLAMLGPDRRSGAEFVGTCHDLIRDRKLCYEEAVFQYKVNIKRNLHWEAVKVFIITIIPLFI